MAIRLVGLVGLVCLVATCRDAGVGLGGPQRVAQLAVNPVLPSSAQLAAFDITADSLRILVVRPPATVLVDTTVYFPPDSTSLAVAITVALEAASENLDVTVELRGGGFALFSGTQNVAVQVGPNPAPTIALAFVGPGNNVDTLKLSPLDSVISFGDSLRYQVTAVDATGSPVTQFYVSWSTSDSNVARANANGVVRAPNLRAGVRVRVSTPNGRADSTAVTFIPVPTTVTAVSGGGQSAAPGTLLPQPLVAMVTAADALGVQGIVVHFQATVNGSVTTADVVTDAQGNAQTTATLGALVGASSFQASVTGVATPATFGATVLSVGATQLVFTGQPPAVTTAGAVLAPAITVELRDAQNQVDASASDAVTIALGTNPGGATLGGTTTVAAVNGVATFANLSLDKVAAGYTLVATASGLTQATSNAFAIGAAAASQLAITAHPPSALAGTTFGSAVVVQAKDAFGNLNTGFAGVVNLGIGTNPGGGSLAGPTAVAAVGGIATFSGLSIDNPGAGYTLVASTGGLTSDTSGTIAIAPPTAGRFWIAAGGGNWSNPANWSGGIVPGANDTVFIALGGTYTVTVDVNDTVTFLFVGGATGTQTLAISSHTLGIDSGASFNTSAVIDLANATLNTSQNGFFIINGTVAVAPGPSQIAGTVGVTGTGLLRLTGNNGNAVLIFPGELSNQGTIELTGTSWGGSLQIGGVFTNAPGATLHTTGGTGHTLSGELANFGAIQIDHSLAVSGISVNSFNTGTIVLAGGDVSLVQSGISPTFTSDGTIVIGAGRTLSVNGGSFDYAGGSIGGYGSLVLNGTTLGLTPDFTHDTLALSVTSSVVDGPGTLRVAGGTPLVLSNSTINAPVVNEGTLIGNFGTNTFNAAYSHAPGALLRLNGNNGNAIFNMAGAFTNQGTIELTGTSWGGVLLLGGTLTNAPGATLHAGAGAGHTLTGELDNQGTILIDQTLTLNGIAAAHQNSGTITLAGGNFALNQSGATPSFTTTGTVTVGLGRTWTVTGGALDYDGGTIQGTGVLALNSATLNLTPDFVHDTLAIALTNSVVNGPGSLTVAGATTLVMSNSIVNAPLVNQGTVQGTFGTNALNGAYTHAPGAVLHLVGSNGPAILNIDSSFTNQGAIELTGTSWGGMLAVAGTLTNAPGATLHAGVGANHQFTGSLNNQGTVLIDNSLTLNGVSAAHQNSGTITLGTGNLTLSQSGTTPSFTTTGTVTIGAGRTWGVTGGAVNYDGGAILGTGVLALNSATLNLTPDFVHDTLALTLTNSVVNGPGSLTIAGGTTLVMSNSVVNAPLVDQGTLQGSFGTNALNGAFTLASGAVLRLVGNNGPAILNVDSAFTNQGTIELTGTSWGGVVAVNGTLTNAPGATVHASAGTNHSVTGTLNNQGTVLIDNLLTLNGVSAAHANAGTITLAGGNLTLSQSGTTPSFTTTGTIVVGPGHTWAVTGGTLDYAGGVLGGPGVIALNSTTLNLTPAFTHDTLTLALTNSVVNGPGTLTVAGATPLTMTNSTVNAPLLNQGVLNGTFGTNTVNGPFSNSSGAILLLSGTNGPATLNVDSAFTNQGTIQLTGTGWGGVLAVAGTLTNAAGGLLHAVSGTNHFFTGTLDNQGSLQVDQPLTLNGVSATHINTGSIGIGGGNLTITQSGISPWFTNRGIVEVGAGRTATVTGGSLVNDTAGTLRGTGTLSVAGTSFSNTGAVSPGTSPGLLTITGPFPMAPAAVLNIELGGLAAGTQYDRLAVSGTATMGGILNVTLLSGFTPAVADSFAILTCGTSCIGAFNQLILPAGMSAGVVGNTVVVTQVTLVGAGTVSWVAGSGLWSNPANWSGAAVPSSSDTVRIDVAGTYTVTLDVNATFGRLVLGGGSGTQTLSGNSRTLTLGDGGTIAASGALSLTGNSAINGGGTLTNQGSLSLDADVALALVNPGLLTVPGGALANLNGGLTQTGSVVVNGNSGPATLATSSGFTNQGSIQLTGTSWSGGLQIAGGAGTMINAAGATLTAFVGVNNTVNAGLDNQGTVQVDGPLDVFLGGGTMTATGGTLAVSAGQTLRVDGGTLQIGSGTVQGGTGTINLTGTATLNLASDVTFAPAGTGPQWQLGGTVTVTGPGRLTNQGTLILTDDVVNADVDNPVGATLELPGGSSSQLNGSLGQAGTLRLNGNSGPAQLTVATGFTNQGTLELTGTSWGGELTVTSGTLTNTGTLQVLNGSANAYTGAFDNLGTVTVGGPLTFNNAGQTLTGTAGTFTVAAGRTLTVNGGTLAIGGATGLSGTGTIALDAPATLSLASDVTLLPTAPAWTFPGGVVTVNGPGALINQATLQLTDDIVNAALVNQGTLELPGGSSSQMSGALTQTGLLRLNGNSGAAVLTVATGFTNQGTLELTGTSWGGELTVTSGTLTNAATLQVLNGSANAYTGAFDNQGTVGVGGPLTFNNAGQNLPGTAGTFDVVTGRTLTVSGGTLTIGSGTGLTGSGTISLVGTTTLALASDVTLAMTGPTWTLPGIVTVTGPGALINQTTLQLTDEIVTTAVNNQGTLELPGGSASQLNGALTQTGTLRLNGNSGPADLVVAQPFTNQGTIELTGTSWGGFLNGNLTNASGATLQVVNGAGSGFTGPFDNQGTVSIGGPMTFFNTGQTLQSTAGTLFVSGGQTLTVNSGGLAIGSGTGLVGTGTIALNGPATLSLASAVTFAASGPAWSFPGGGAVAVTGPGTLINQGSLLLTSDQVNAPLVNQGTLELPGGSTSFLNGALTQTGTLRLNGNSGPAHLTVASGFTNQGTLELTGTSWGGELVVTGGTLTNASGATLGVMSGIANAYTGAFDNQGTVTVGGPLTFNNTGQILLGTAGVFDIAATRTLTVNGGTLSIGSGTGQTGTGTLSLAGTTTLALVTDVTVPAPGTGPSWAFPGVVTVNGPGTLINQGTLPLTDDIVNAALNNQGTLEVPGGSTSQVNGGLTQTGTLRLNGNSGPAQLTVASGFSNQGTLELTGSSWGGELTVTSGTLTNASGATLRALNGVGNNYTGVVDNQGTVLVNGPLVLGAGTYQNDGTIEIASTRTLTVATGGSFTNLSGGALRGNGTLNVAAATVFSNAGAISPGIASPGTLTVTGALPLTATSVLAIELGGTNPGQFDQIAVSGTATQGGTLNVTLTGGFTPALSQTFPVITTGSGILGGFGQSIFPPGMVAAVVGNNLVLNQATSATGALISWAGAVSGAWSNPNNWSPAVVPAGTDTAVINVPGTYTVTLDIDAAVAKLLLGTPLGGSQTLSGSGRTLTVGAGSMISAGGALTLTGASTLDGASVLTNQGTLTLTGSVANVPIANQRLVSASTSTLNGQVTTAGGDTVRIGAGGAGTVTFTKGFTVNGRLQYRIPSGTNVLAVTQGPLVIAPGAVLEVLAAGGAAGTFTGALDNQGTLTNAVALTINGASAVHSNTGTISLGGNLTVSQSGTGAGFTNAGTILVPASRILTTTGGTFTQTAAGSLSGLGTATFIGLSSADFATAVGVRRVTMDGVPVTLAASQTLGGRWTLTDVPLSGAAMLTVGPGDTLDFTNGSAGLSLVNQGLVRAVGTFTLTGTLTTASGSTLRVGNLPGATTGGGTITIANGFTNTGNLELMSTGGSVLTLGISTGTLVNAAGGTILNDPSGAGTRRLSAPLDNQGALTVNHSLALNLSGAAHSNAGTITIASGQTLTVDNGGTLTVPASGIVQGLGTLDARTAFTSAAGTTVSLGGLSLAGSVSIGGSYTVGTTTFTGPAPVIPVLPYTNLVMNGTGTATLAGNTNVPGNLNVTRGVLGLVGQAVNVGGNLAVSGTGTGLTLGAAQVTLGGGFSTAASGILNMTNGSGILTVNGDASFGGGGTNSILSAGRMFVRGNFSQTLGATAAFAATGTHRVILDGTGIQMVTFASPDTGGSTSHFRNLELLNTAGSISLGSNVFVNDTLKSTPPAGLPKVVGGGFLVTTRGLLVNSLQLDRALLKFRSLGTGLPTFNNVNFVNFLDSDLQFNIEHPGNLSVMVFSNINFTPFTTGTGYYLRVDDTDDVQPNLLQISISHYPIDLSNAIARTLRIGTLLPQVTWLQ